jgi:hypothetical protein
MAKIQEPPSEIRGGGKPGPLMSPVAAFVVVLVGFLLVLGGIGYYVRSRQPALEAQATTVPVATTGAAISQAAQAPTQVVAPPAVVSTAGPTPAPATQAGPAPQATPVPTVQPAVAAPAAEPAGQPTSAPAAAGVRVVPTALATAPQPTAQPTVAGSSSDLANSSASEERIPLAVTGDVDPALVSELEHAYWVFWQRYTQADATLDANLMGDVADQATIDGLAKLYDEERGDGHSVHTDVRHQATLQSATPNEAVIFDIQEGHSYYVSLATGEPEEPTPDVTTTKVLYQFSKIGDSWKETGEELP